MRQDNNNIIFIRLQRPGSQLSCKSIKIIVKRENSRIFVVTIVLKFQTEFVYLRLEFKIILKR